MERKVVLEVVAHKPPVAAIERTDGLHELVFDLVDVFHQGYIEVHDRPPKTGTNPFFDEYAQLLVEDSDYLKWTKEIGRGDHKGSESQKLGRIFARAYLSLHGYTWFPDVKELLSAPERGWSVRRPDAGGNMPDWLVGDTTSVAVAEAKGTHSAIHAKSTVLEEKWRPQVKNIEVFKDGQAVRLKGWIIATRWVGADQPQTEPKMYAEDPEVPGERDVGPDDAPSFVTWLARVHTSRNLRRLGQHAVAQRLAAPSAFRQRLPQARPMAWTCTAPGLAGVRFVGRPMGDLSFLPSMPLDWRLWREFGLFPIDREAWERWARLQAAAFDDAMNSMWFDGVAVPVLDALVTDTTPPTLREMGVESVARPGVSVLADGSLLAPMALMVPAERVYV